MMNQENIQICQLFGLPIYTQGSEQLLEYIKCKQGKIHIISGNAEVLKAPLNNKNSFGLFLREENVIIPDGISIYYPLTKKNGCCKKILGIEFMQKLLDEFQNAGKSVYFLGASDRVIQKLIPNIRQLYPNLRIAGYHHGYFDKTDCNSVIENIKLSHAYALFVALGTPFQERFIFQYIDELPCTVFMGVGGSFDVLSGTIKRSPKWLRNIGFEWLYRLICDPSKIDRIWHNIQFIIKAFVYG